MTNKSVMTFISVNKISVCLSVCTGFPYETTKQTEDSEPMLVSCWASVVDGGPTLNQHRVTVSVYQTTRPSSCSLCGFV